MAGLDGIRNRIEPPEPIDKDLYELPPEEHAEIKQLPESLGAVLDALEADHEYLTEGDVFPEDLISTWIDLKRTTEIDPFRFRPHPHEFRSEERRVGKECRARCAPGQDKKKNSASD